ncbi:unnamed protein product, partial [marine sediment metagenome]
MFDYKDSSIKGHGEAKEDVVDATTARIYKSQKASMFYVKDRIKDLKPAMKKHFEDVTLFIEGYEAGVIKHW